MTRLTSVTALAVASACLTGCGSAGSGSGGGAPLLLRAGDFPGWHAVDDAPGIGGLAPDLSGLHVAGRTDSPALVRGGNAVRVTEIVFSTQKDAAEAVKRGSEDDYRSALERSFRGDTVSRGPGAGYRLRVPRPTGHGLDTVDLLLVRKGRRVAVVEFVSARGFDPALRARIVRLVSR